jgi:hydrogenase maturation protease
VPDGATLTPAAGRAASSCLIVGIGNDLRHDDGAGRVVAESLRGAPEGLVDVRVTHQLVPELADAIRAYERVVFVDAAVDVTQVRSRRLVPAPLTPSPGSGHHGDAAQLLTLAAICGGPVPSAWLVTIPAGDLAVGEGLSPATAAHLLVARAQVTGLLHGGTPADLTAP